MITEDVGIYSALESLYSQYGPGLRTLDICDHDMIGRGARLGYHPRADTGHVTSRHDVTQ